MIKGVGDILARQLLQTVGSEETIFQEKPSALEKIPGIGRNLAREIIRPEVLHRAAREMDFIEKKQIKTFFITDPDYPYRLKECPDAPYSSTTRGGGEFK
ncbi:MAG: helix-hairpin-helix domain-containing protein [Tannerellaceae bacterium]|nr:helix-hairpin-helix domain-containing protein [Tannerellaceae bacterium]